MTKRAGRTRATLAYYEEMRGYIIKVLTRADHPMEVGELYKLVSRKYKIHPKVFGTTLVRMADIHAIHRTEHLPGVPVTYSKARRFGYSPRIGLFDSLISTASSPGEAMQ